MNYLHYCYMQAGLEKAGSVLDIEVSEKSSQYTPGENEIKSKFKAISNPELDQILKIAFGNKPRV